MSHVHGSYETSVILDSLQMCEGGMVVLTGSFHIWVGALHSEDQTELELYPHKSIGLFSQASRLF